MAHDAELADRIRSVLAGRPDIAEKRMVGGVSFSVDGRMCCGVSGRALMVRVGADSREPMLGLPNVRPMVLGGKVVTGFVLVGPDGIATERDLEAWIQRGIAFAAGLPRGAPRPRLTP
jgi:hypothetical protein